MIQEVVACEFLGRTISGRSRPMRCVCADQDGRDVYVYVKYENFHEELIKDHLVAEVVANLFAEDIGLPCARPCLVRVDPDFVSLLPKGPECDELRSALDAAPLMAFGSVQLQPVRRWAVTDLVHRSQMREAILLYLFDTIVENSDRGRRNPNLLINGEHFKVIDFGHSFQRCHAVGLYEATVKPWRNGGIMNHFDGDLQHIMYQSIIPPSEEVLQEFTTTLGGLDDDRILSYMHCIPDEWGHDTTGRIIDYLIEARDHVEEFAEQVRRVLR